MDKENYTFYTQTNIIDYKGYRLVTFENTVVVSLKRYLVAIFKGNIKIGESEVDNAGLAIKELKERIDQANARDGSRLEYLHQ